MMKLSKEQAKVVKELETGLYVWTNEGSNLKAWVGGKNAKITRNLRVSTVEALYNKNKIVLDEEGDYPRRLFRYKLEK